MRKITLISFLAVAFLCMPSLDTKAQMTDEAIIDYVKTHSERGDDDKTIAKNLLAKGVSVEQIKKIKARYDAQQAGTYKTADDVLNNGGQTNRISEATSQRPETMIARSEAAIYGHEMFTGTTMTFEPNLNIATPDDYKLGPGDEIVVDIWGLNEAHVSQFISPEGRIMISQIGPVYLSGLTIKEVKARISSILAQKYASEGGDIPDSQISVTLGNIRTVQVNIIGEVGVPGTYRLSSFASAFNALYIAGGITGTGSMRKVKIVRSGKEIACIDLYKYLYEGLYTKDIRLEDGDVILVPTYDTLVTIDGEVKRPMKYEVVEGESIEDLINYAGGFASKAYEEEVTLVRKTQKEYKLVNVPSSEYSTTKLENGDLVTISEIADRYINKVEVKGCVYRPGLFELGGGVATVRQLIDHAAGVKEDAYMERALLIREKIDLTLETKAFNLRKVLSGEDEDILLRKNDVVIISSQEDLKEDQYVTVIGYVLNPGNFIYAENTTLKDAIFQAGGFMDGASNVKIDVSRRINKPSNTFPSDTMSHTVTFSIKNGLEFDGMDECVLQPYDVVAVRKSPEYKEQHFVNITGQVAFEGDYVITSNNERISDIVKRAGGLTEHAYLRGARLIRRMSEDEKNVRRATLSMIESGAIGKDSVDTSTGLLSATYTVGIELDKALENPGSDYDLVVRKDDSIIVPEYIGTVKIQGTVMYPNTVVYIPGKNLNYYIEQAGGFAYRAKRGSVYVVYMNGNVKKIRKSSDLEPGCEIIVPQKPERRKMSTGEVLSLSTTTASLATMVATLINIFK